MRRVLVVSSCVLAAAGASLTAFDMARSRQSARPAAASGVREALAAYLAGDDLAVERWLATPEGLTAIPTLHQAVTDGSWNRGRAAFLLEAAALHPIRAAKLLAAWRSMVMSRPAALGSDPAEDRFEILWHQTAIALLQSVPWFTLQREYLDAVEPRFAAAARRGANLETRLPLARATAAGIACCWKPVPGEVVRSIPNAARVATSIDHALKLFTDAAERPALRAEAFIRGGKLLHDAGRTAEALVWLERAPVDPDASVNYVKHLTLGRVLDGANRAADAAAAYQAALTFAPEGQQAAIGLAAALLRTGRPDEAARVAQAAAHIADDRAARAQEFNRADFRFVRAWLAEIRRLRR